MAENNLLLAGAKVENKLVVVVAETVEKSFLAAVKVENNSQAVEGKAE
jgi:hypothetical protein